MKKNASGFTLAEILVVIVIISIVGTVMVMIFTNTLRGSNKSQILSAMKQNGQAVLENIDKTIRDSDNLVCLTSSFPGNTVVVVQNGIYTRYRIVLSTDAVGPSSCVGSGKNGCIAQDHPTKQIDSGTSQLETDSVFRSSVCSARDPMPRSGSTDTANVLTDTNAQTGVQINSGSFNASKPSGFKAAISINFVLSPGVQAPASVAGQVEPVSFQTTIGLR